MESLYSFDITKTNEIIFHISEYKDIHYGNIRKFVKSERYTGVTPKGITLTLEQLNNVYEKLKELPKSIENLEEDSYIVSSEEEKTLRVDVSVFKGSFYINIRFYSEIAGGYNGPTKKGISLQFVYMEDLMNGIRALIEYLSRSHTQIKEEQITGDNKSLDMTEDKESNILIPKKYEDYFN